MTHYLQQVSQEQQPFCVDDQIWRDTKPDVLRSAAHIVVKNDTSDLLTTATINSLSVSDIVHSAMEYNFYQLINQNNYKMA